MTQIDPIQEDDYTSRFDWGMWRKLFQAVGRYRRQWVALCVR
ncbi:MAG: hypothetical protein NTV86_13395 [Planctomycetota bacterium]|nr:hypothetical protein [Planctomycetota bacterium]